MDSGNLDTSDGSMKSAASNEDMFAVSQDMFASSPPESSEKVSDNEGRQDVLSNDDTTQLNSLGNETWRGTPLDQLGRYTLKAQYPPVTVSSRHTVLFKLPVKTGEVPPPWPEKPLDVWDQNHVRMPHSESSLYPVTDTELRRRWELVRQSLTTQITSSQQLEAAIFHYNSKYCERWNFTVLHTFFSETLEEIESDYFFKKVLPQIVELALSLPSLVTGGVPLLRQHNTHSVSLTQRQISSLLANAFLCTFPRRNTTKKGSEYSSYPYINFNRLFSGDFIKPSRMNCVQEKLKCIINYFRRVTNKVPEGVVTFTRHYVPPDKLPTWSDETCCLPRLHISTEGTIEDGGTGMLQVDFANKNVGGGVLGSGCVQEEIRFVICPELIIARLFTEVLDETEALIINGVERYSTYSGYSDNFEWAGDVEDPTPRDCHGRRYCTVVAVDALRFPSAKTQFTVANVNRELNKAYAGFSWGSGPDRDRVTVATGNWGCGAFRGDARLKGLLQLMAAAATGRDLAYFTFGDDELRDDLANMHEHLVQRNITVGKLWRIITSYRPQEHRHSLYDHIYQSVDSGSIPLTVKSPIPPYPKKPRIQNADNAISIFQSKKPDQRLSMDDIEKELEITDSIVGDDAAKPVEGKTLNVNSDKELCLKKLSSSWTNLNDSKKDFKPAKDTVPEQTGQDSSTKPMSNSSTPSSALVRKKKISDYFQPAGKH